MKAANSYIYNSIQCLLSNVSVSKTEFFWTMWKQAEYFGIHILWALEVLYSSFVLVDGLSAQLSVCPILTLSLFNHPFNILSRDYTGSFLPAYFCYYLHTFFYLVYETYSRCLLLPPECFSWQLEQHLLRDKQIKWKRRYLFLNSNGRAVFWFNEKISSGALEWTWGGLGRDLEGTACLLTPSHRENISVR